MFHRCLSTIGLMDTGSLLGFDMARSARILLECFTVFNENRIVSVIAALTLTLGVNRPLKKKILLNSLAKVHIAVVDWKDHSVFSCGNP